MAKRHSIIILLFVIIASAVVFVHSLSLKQPCTVRICQNKDCRSRYPSTAAAGETLARTFRDLVAPSGLSQVAVEASECLGQCGRGPNVAVNCNGNGGGRDKMYYGVVDPQTAAAILEVSCDYDPPPMLLAAADVMARAGKATSPSKKVSLLTSAVDALSGDSTLSSASAVARALVLRADARMDADPTDTGGEALGDAQRAAELGPSYGKAWRTLADAREAGGDFSGAVEAVRRWAEAEPSLARKAKGEVERLIARM
uniref:Uncharacterized protein n=1 Tax=Odontella aurita TaxID=265563 RepID=A0A7S4JLI4_9STRA|mmetsp:Transcript_48933/g.147413  ORF Transcript_48933/g.147413 Transcript_48933/m.147413 type:complete len:257 (+) Transcript_48933:116-886(+)